MSQGVEPWFDYLDGEHPMDEKAQHLMLALRELKTVAMQTKK